MIKDLKYKSDISLFLYLPEKISSEKTHINKLTSFTNFNLSVQTGTEEDSNV
jgi:hypothetical protein